MSVETPTVVLMIIKRILRSFLTLGNLVIFIYISITILIISNIYRLQCTNSVLFGKMAASRSK